MIKGSVVYNSQKKRPLTALAHFEVQGNAVFSESTATTCSFRSLLDLPTADDLPPKRKRGDNKLSETDVKSIAGNSMHVAAVSIGIMFALASGEDDTNEK